MENNYINEYTMVYNIIKRNVLPCETLAHLPWKWLFLQLLLLNKYILIIR